MSKIIIIAAIGKNRELGKDNHLIWHLKEDLKFFKENTMNHKIVMGYNTFVSLNKLLPGREHIVLTHRKLNIADVQIFNDFNELLTYIKALDEDIYIIGGESIYRLFLEHADELLLTEINAECKEADAYFPNWDKEDYNSEILKSVDEEEMHYQHVRYRKK